MNNRTNLVGRRSAEIGELLAAHIDREFRGRQVAQWIIDRNATGFADMTNLPLSLRQDLDRHFSIEEPEILEVIESSDGSCKYLFGLSDGVGIEGVSMRDGAKATFCLSSQAAAPSAAPSVSPAPLAQAATFGRMKSSASTGRCCAASILRSNG
jgi:23S rRNA (adenine2503-C2)-methyltransferase